MPASDAHTTAANQEKEALGFLIKFARILAKLRSEFPGERASARVIAIKMIDNPAAPWEDLNKRLDAKVNPDKLAVALEAAAFLKAQNEELRAEIEHLHATGNALITWTDVNARSSEVNIVARWALDLHRRGKAQLTAWEADFIADCTTWTRPLSQKMKPKFEQIINHIIRRTGELPPTI